MTKFDAILFFIIFGVIILSVTIIIGIVEHYKYKKIKNRLKSTLEDWQKEEIKHIIETWHPGKDTEKWFKVFDHVSYKLNFGETEAMVATMIVYKEYKNKEK